MRLRALEQRDAERMLSWMHDSSVVDKLQTNFARKTIDDCKHFINNSQDEENIHLAIVDNEDQYMGTVSLKHITKVTAEFAITLCKDAMGKGYSLWAMNEIIKLGFQKYGISHIYWCVAPNNKRALRFYDKNQFPQIEVDKIRNVSGYTKKQIDSYIWYQINLSQFVNILGNDGCVDWISNGNDKYIKDVHRNA